MKQLDRNKEADRLGGGVEQVLGILDEIIEDLDTRLRQ